MYIKSKRSYLLRPPVSVMICIESVVFKIESVVKKTRIFFRRGICILLTSCILSMTVASDYLGARYVQANPFVVVGAEKLIETVLLSLGITVAFSSDLKTLAKRLSYNIDEWTADEQACIQEMIDSGKVKINDSAVGKIWAKLKSKVKGIVVPNDKSATKPKVPDILDTSVALDYQYGMLTQKSLFSVWNNIPLKFEEVDDTGAHKYVSIKNTYEKSFEGVLTSGFCLVGKKINTENGKMTFSIYYPPSVAAMRNCYLQYSNDTFQLCSNSDGTIYKNGSYTGYSIQFSKSSTSADYIGVNKKYVIKEGGVPYLRGVFTDSTLDQFIANFSASASDSESVSLCLYSAVPVYESYQDYVKTNTAATAFPLAGDIYGNGEAAIDDSKDFSLTTGEITKTVEDALNDYVKEHPDATDEEKNDVVAGILPKIDDVNDHIEDTTDEVVTSNSWLSKIYTKINTRLDTTLSSVKSAIVDGTSALKEDTEDIRDSFKVIKGGGSQEPEEDPDPEPHVWAPVIPDTAKFLKPVLEFLGKPLSIITKYLDKLKTSAENALKEIKSIRVGWQEWIKGTYDNCTGIFNTQLPNIIQVLQGLAGSAVSLPANIASSLAEILPDALNNVLDKIEVIVPPIEIPDIEIAPVPVEVEVPTPEINFPPIPDYTGLLQQILAAIQNIFALDADAVGDAQKRFNDAVDDVVPDLPDFPKLFGSFQTTDKIEYPVFKMQTPKVLREYYDHDYIILLDCKDYAEYIVWIRRILQAAIWLTFAYTVLCHFKVDLSVE